MVFKSLLTVAAVASLATAPRFHTALKWSDPAKDSSVVSPAKVTLTFTEGVNAGVSAISILKTDSTEVEKLAVKAGKDAATIEGAVAKPLAPGKYVIRWRTASADGHAVRGAYGFTVVAKK